MTTVAGRFSVTLKGDGTLDIAGPAPYMEQYSQDKIRSSAELFLRHKPDLTIEAAVATALQTDFAAWLGARRMGG